MNGPDFRAEAEHLAVLNRIARIAASGDELRPTLQRMVEALREGFGWEFVACVSVDLAAKRFVCEAVTSSVETDVYVGYGRELGSGIVGRVAETGEPILLDDVRTDPTYIETFPGALSELCVPVKHRGHLVAILNLESLRLAAFHDQLPVLTNVAEQVAGALDLSRTNQELSEANRRLVEINERLSKAEQQIARLLESPPVDVENIPAWSRVLALEVARTIGAREIDVWALEDGRTMRLTDGRTRPPSPETIRSLSSGENARAGADELIVPLEGLGGEKCGALVVAGLRFALEESHRLLVAGFARQLGGALETRRLARQLAAAEARRASTLREMHARGIATAQVCPLCGRCFDHNAVSCTADGSRLDASRLLPYLVADRYRLERLVGQGGMGTVFAARDERLGRDVAVKLIRHEQLGSSESLLRLKREAEIVARIPHPGVVALFDTGELEDGSVYLVMELLRGADVGDLLERYGNGTPRQVARLLREGGAALSAAHRAGVVHRDIKPHNFFFATGAAGLVVKLLDFGLARPLTFDRNLTRAGAVVGTPAYMSPEQASGQALDARSDLYSFAAVAYEALLGIPAAPGHDAGRIMRRVVDETPEAPSRVLATLPSQVDAAFARAFEKRPDARPDSVEMWVETFVSALEEVPPLTTGWTLPGATGAIRKRHLEAVSTRELPR